MTIICNPNPVVLVTSSRVLSLLPGWHSQINRKLIQDPSGTKCPLSFSVIWTLWEWLVKVSGVEHICIDWTQCCIVYSQQTTPRHAIGHRGWSRRRTRGAGAGGRSWTRRRLLPGRLCSWRNEHASPCRRTPSTGDKHIQAEINICIVWN